MTTAAFPLSPLARLVIFLDSIPDDPSHPDYAKWQTTEPVTVALPPEQRRRRQPTTVQAVVSNAA